MEENLSPESSDSAQPPANPAGSCAKCGNPSVEPGHPTALCSECRQELIRFPIPLWIRYFAGAIGIILVYSLLFTPGNFTIALHLEKGKKAEKENKYHTAQALFEQVVKKVPDNLEANGHLAKSAFYNLDFSAFAASTAKLNDKTIEDNQLVADLNELVERANSYYPGDSLQQFLKEFPNEDSIPDTAWSRYTRKYPDDLLAATDYASRLIEEKHYAVSDSLLTAVLGKRDDFIPALMVMPSMKRLEGKLDESMHYCDVILGMNQELPYAIASRVRTLLAMKKDRQALDLALSAYQQNPKDVYCMGSLILADHFNNRTEERDALINKCKPPAIDSADVGKIQYVKDVISGKEKFRD